MVKDLMSIELTDQDIGRSYRIGRKEANLAPLSLGLPHTGPTEVVQKQQQNERPGRCCKRHLYQRADLTAIRGKLAAEARKMKTIYNDGNIFVKDHKEM